MKKIDLSTSIYVVLMLVVFLLAACSPARRIPVIPAPKYTPSNCCKIDTTCWNGLKISDYESHSGFNYLEDAIKFLD